MTRFFLIALSILLIPVAAFDSYGNKAETQAFLRGVRM